MRFLQFAHAYAALFRRRVVSVSSGLFVVQLVQERQYSSLLGRRGENGRKKTVMETIKEHSDKYIFIACLVMAIILMVFGAVMPPPGIIDPSILTASGILLGFAALGVAGQNLANGKDVTFKKDDTEITIGDNDEEA